MCSDPVSSGTTRCQVDMGFEHMARLYERA
jgi:hypothetical protein